MPESINDISNDMEQLRKSTEETAQQMAELQAKIEGVIRALAEARGKTVSPESVTRAAQRVTGEEQVPGRVTVAPGQRIRTGAIGTELRTLQEEAKAIEQVSRATTQSTQVTEQATRASNESVQAGEKEVHTIREVTAAYEQALKILAEFSVKKKEANQTTAQSLIDAVGNAGVADYRKQQEGKTPIPIEPADNETNKVLTEREQLLKRINEENRKVPGLADAGLAAWKAQEREIERIAEIERQINAQRQARPKVFAEAEKRGFTPGQPGFNVQATEEASSGISRTTFAYRDMDGTLKRLSVTQDRFGNVLVDTQRRFRSLGDAIIRDTVEVFKWTVAVALIYAPLQKLQESITLMIKNEAELANITIILGKAQGDLVSVFNAAAKAAQATGESIDGVLEGYTLAYRATGVYTDQVQRANVAQKLLIDSLTLSKLAGGNFASGANDQAEALDTLVAALRQMNLGLDQGSILLNKWVAVTKAANVDLKTLSELFAITATSAESAGLSIDELNGIIATISEATSLSATEAGNAVRAIISGLNTDAAKQKLLEYGIAVEDTGGKLRNFMDVFRDIASLRTAGLIDDRGFKELASAIGGQGARRGAQVEAVLGNLQRAGELAKVSASAQNDAYDALGIKLDTVQTKITELNNAFQKLSLTLGEDGGMLDTLKTILSVATSITNAFTGLVQTLGRAAPILATAGVGLSYLGGSGKLQGAAGGAANFLLQNSSIARTVANNRFPRSGMGAGTERIEGVSNVAADTFSDKMRANAPLIGVAIAEAFVAASNIKERNWEGLFGQVLGGAFGAIVGGPYGALIGSTIGQSIADTLFNYKTEFADFFKVPEAPRGTGPKGEETQVEKVQREAQELALSAAGGKANVKTAQVLYNTANQGKPDLTELEAAHGIIQSITKLKPGQFSLLGHIVDQKEIDQAIVDLERLNALIDEGRKLSAPEGNQQQGIETPFSKEAAADLEKNQKLMSDTIKRYEGDLRTSLNKQEVSIKEFKDQTDFFAAGGTSVLRVYTALKGSADSLAGDLTKISDTLRDANTEQRAYISQITTQIADLVNEIDNLRKTDISMPGGGTFNTGQIESLEKTKKEMQDIEVEYLKGIEYANKFNSIKLTPIVNGEGLNMDEFNLVLEEAQRKQSEYLQSLALQQGLSPDMIEDLKKSYDPWFIYLEGRYKEVTNLDPQQFENAKKAFEEIGKITIKPPEPFGIRTIDQERDPFKAAYARAEQFVTTRFPQYKVDEKEQGVIFKNNVTDVLHLDNLITQIALQELIDVSKKQLEGIYNLPSDSSFYVPFQGYKLGPQGGEGGALTGLDTAATNATGSLNTLANAIYRMTGTYLPQNALGPLPTSNLPKPSVAPPMTGTYLPGQQGQTTVALIAAIQSGFAKMTGTYLPTTPPKTAEQQKPDWMTNDYQRESAKRNAAYPGIQYKPNEPLSLWNRPGLDIPAQPYKETVPQAPTVNTRLQLDINSNVLLQVDGRTLANIVKVYLYEDMTRTEGTSGSIVKAVII